MGGLECSVLAGDVTQTVPGALGKGCDYLFSQQAADGGWHSTTYGALKGGAAVTALVLYTASFLPAERRRNERQRFEQAFRFFDAGFKKRSVLASPDGSLDYPTYAVPLWLIGAKGLPTPPPAERVQKLVDYLIAAQLTESRGFERSHAAYGGWDFLGSEDAQGITTGANISVITFAVEALRLSEHPRKQIALDRARDWLFRCQDATGDGGFAFTTEPMSLNNKAEFRDARQLRPRSYGTATADGLRALIHCGVEPTDPRVTQAVTWLAKRISIDVVPGFDDLPLELGWQRGLRFYYLAALSQVLSLLPATASAKRRDAISASLAAEQKKDGSWQNETPRMREDDPLIATCFALLALTKCLEAAE